MEVIRVSVDKFSASQMSRDSCKISRKVTVKQLNLTKGFGVEQVDEVNFGIMERENIMKFSH